MALLVTDAIRWWVRAQPDAPAIDFEGEIVTYGELGAWTDRVATSLINDHGITPGDVIAVAGANSIEWSIAALAALKAGAIFTPVNFRYMVSEVEFLVDDSSPRIVFADDTESAKFEEVKGKGHDFKILNLATIRDFESGPHTPVRVEVSPSDPTVLAYTSGTTGQPKGLNYTHETLLGALFELILQNPTAPEDTRMLLTLPLFSAPGAIHALIYCACRGATMVLMRDFHPGEALRLLLEKKITHINAVPLIYERIAALPEFENAQFPHLRVANAGGARVSDDLLNAWNQRGAVLRHMYGMTEIGGFATSPRPADALAHPELCGDGGIFTDLKIMRADGTEADPDEPGEIVMRGPGMMAGYWNNPEATEQAVVNGWLHSGDLGSINENGYLRYLDRLKDLVISGGFNISPSEVESVITKVDGVTEVAVIPIDDKEWGEVPAAIVYSDKGAVDPESVKAVVSEHLAVFKVPRYVVAADEPLPRMASGKLDKRKLREDYAHLAPEK